MDVALIQSATFLGAVLSGGLAWFAWRHRAKRGGGALVVLTLAIAVWNATVLGASIDVGYGTSVVFFKIHMVALTLVMPALAVLLMQYAGRADLVTKRRLGLLLIEPAAVAALEWSDDPFDLFLGYVPADGHVPSAGALTQWAFTGVVPVVHGPLFWLHAVYIWGLALACLVFILWLRHRQSVLHRKQLRLLTVALAIPLTASVIDNLAQWQFRLSEPALVVTGVALTVAVVRYDFLDVMPIARSTVIEEVRTGVAVLDERDRLVDVNDAGARFLGGPAAELVGRHAADVLADQPELWQHYAEVDAGSELIAVDVAAGTSHFEVRVSPLTDGDDVVGRVFLFQDVTERRERERELERQNERLDQFASVVSHDLRNPLNTARGSAELVAEHADGEVAEHVDRLQRAHGRMERIIEDVLTMAREGDRPTDVAPVRLADVAERAWGGVETADATFRNELDGVVDADEGRLLRVFENLFRNAVEHAGPGVTVRAGLVDGADGALPDPSKQGFYVADDGPGIPPGERDAIFEMGHSRSSGGTGLGLAIVEQIAAAHGWTIDVVPTDAPDDGARFEITGVVVRDVVAE